MTGKDGAPGWTLTGDVGEYLEAAGGFLRARAAENTVLLTVSEVVRIQGAGAFGESAPVFGWWQEPGSGIAGAFLHTPPYAVALTSMTSAAAANLADVLADRGRTPSGVHAPTTGSGADGTADAFAARWQDRTGQRSRLVNRQRLYRLGTLMPPDPAPAGRARVAGEPDRALLVAWMNAFHDEATPSDPPGTERAVSDRLGYGGLTLWEAGGQPVSLAGVTRPVAGQIRIGPVYTPPACRGQGFGGAVTAAVSQAALDTGVADVLLYTDLANPTSNSLYQRLGFQPVSDRVYLAFE